MSSFVVLTTTTLLLSLRPQNAFCTGLSYNTLTKDDFQTGNQGTLPDPDIGLNGDGQYLNAVDIYIQQLHTLSEEQRLSYGPLLKQHIEMLKAFSARLPRNVDPKAAAEAKLFSRSKPCESPQAIFLGGGTASGKSSLTQLWEPIVNQSQCGFVHIDPDDIMMELPEWNQTIAYGKCGATILHRTASDWAKEFTARALSESRNVVLDGTMSNDERIFGYAETLRAKNYMAQVLGVTVEPWVAAHRAWARGLATGRFVSLCVIADTHARFARNFKEYIGLFHNNVSLYYTGNVSAGATPLFRNGQVIEAKLYEDFLSRSNLTPENLSRKLNNKMLQKYEQRDRECGYCSVTSAAVTVHLSRYHAMTMMLTVAVISSGLS